MREKRGRLQMKIRVAGKKVKADTGVLDYWHLFFCRAAAACMIKVEAWAREPLALVWCGTPSGSHLSHGAPLSV